MLGLALIPRLIPDYYEFASQKEEEKDKHFAQKLNNELKNSIVAAFFDQNLKWILVVSFYCFLELTVVQFLVVLEWA